MDIKIILKSIMPAIKSQIRTIKINNASLDIDFVFKNGKIIKFTDKELKEILNEFVLCN